MTNIFARTVPEEGDTPMAHPESSPGWGWGPAEPKFILFSWGKKP